MTMLEEKLGGGPADHLVALGVVSGALFLQSSRVRPTLLMAYERLPPTWTARRKHTRGVRGLPAGSVRGAYMDWHGKRICHVY
jgi:hypothetical protein